MQNRCDMRPEVWIPLTRGKFTVVDFKDFEKIHGMKWQAHLSNNNTFYAVRSERRLEGSRATVLLHRFLLDVLPDAVVDHVDGDGLNNRRSNLRLVTNKQNCRNRGKLKGSSSPHKGVCWYKPTEKWHAGITVNGRGIHLGYFLCEEDAALAYDAAARKYFGEWARLNFPTATAE